MTHPTATRKATAMRTIGVLLGGVLLGIAGMSPAMADEPPAPVEASSIEGAVSEAFAGGDSVQLDRLTEGARVPRDSEDGMTVTTADPGQSVTIGLPGADREAALSEAGHAVYEDVAPDTSLVVQPVDVSRTPAIKSAVRTLITIESDAAPTRHAFPLDLPAGVTTQLLPSGSVAAVDEAGRMVGAFAVPWAVDESGATVPTRFEVVGDTLVQVIEHRGAAYPVVADPVWFVPVIVAAVRIAAPIVVRAATSAAAKRAAVAAAKKAYPKKSVKASAPKKAMYRAKTRANARHNLVVRTGKNPKGCQAHHTMPIQFVSAFARAGINIHDAKYLLWWTSKKGLKGNHASKGAEYNRKWDEWFRQFRRTGDTPTKAAILKKQQQMKKAYAKYYRC